MTYQPKPINTKDIILPSELVALTEKLAESTHDNWALGRFNAGWTYGETRDDVHKQHPDLIPYSELLDSEKEYDRQTAMETLKAVLALGYTITKNSDSSDK